MIQPREPVILLVGRLQSTLDVLALELENHHRKVFASNDKERIRDLLSSGSIG